MMPALHMTRAQEKRIYRIAVQASLEVFYSMSKPEAAKLVREWWSRLRSTKAFGSGIFLHGEAMNAAAHIARVEVIAITMKNRAEYHRILNESRDLVLAKTISSPAQVEEVRTDAEKRFLNLPTSVGSISVSGTALRVAAKPKKKKPAQKRQVAYS